MPKTREEITADIQEILTFASPENQARMSELLTGLSNEFDSVLSASEEAEKRAKTLSDNNEHLRKVNTDLFLQVGRVPSAGEGNPNPDPKPINSDLPEITFDKLFNEKGELI